MDALCLFAVATSQSMTTMLSTIQNATTMSTTGLIPLPHQRDARTHHIDGHTLASIANRNITSAKRHHHGISIEPSKSSAFTTTTGFINTLSYSPVATYRSYLNSSDRILVASANPVIPPLDNEEKQYLYTAILVTFYAVVVLGALMVAVWREKRQEIIVGNWDEYMKVRNVIRTVLCLEPMRERRAHDSVRSTHLLDHSETSMDYVIHEDV